MGRVVSVRRVTRGGGGWLGGVGSVAGVSASVGLSDTAAAVAERQVAVWRQWSVLERFEAVEALNDACRQMAEAGVRRRYRSADADEVRLRVLALSLGRELMVAVYGWDPEVEGW